MDWGLGNPNKTSGLIAILMTAVWALAYIRKWGFWTALILFTGLGICLIHTFSRGGLIAAAAGLAILVWYAPRPWPLRRLVSIGTAIWIIVGFSIFVQAHERFGKGVTSEDRSITNRIELWKFAPTMMVDAPQGWGIGQSGISYVRWYQPLDRSEFYRTFVNSHLTWLIELGWFGRFLYLAAWASVILFCWPTKDIRVLAIPFGIWISFGVASLFSSVAESVWLWVVPALAFVFAVAIRLKRQKWFNPVAFSIPTGFALSGCLVLFIIGTRSESLVKREHGITIYGKGDPEYAVLVETSTLGENYQRALRQSAKDFQLPTIGVTESADTLQSLKGAKLVFAGLNRSDYPDALREAFRNAPQVIVVNPRLQPQEIGLAARGEKRITVIFGEFSQTDSLPNWSQFASVETLPSIGDFIPNWPSTIFKIQHRGHE